MHLYASSGELFIEDVLLNRIAEKIKVSFFDQIGFQPSPKEVTSWRNSLQSFANVLSHHKLIDVGVVLEMQLPLTSKRLDCLLTGRNSNGKSAAVVLEFKQWEEAEPSDFDDCVVAFVGGAKRDVLHPSQQALQYKQYLEDSSSAFEEGSVQLQACSYLANHQHRPGSPLAENKFSTLLSTVPMFSGDQSHELGGFLFQWLGHGDGQETLQLVLGSRYKVSKKLLDHVGAVIEGKREYILLDEQQVVHKALERLAKDGFHNKAKTVVLVRGGPGTGKTIIALNVMASLSAEGYNVRHATGSRAFTGNLKKILGSRAATQFSFFNNYVDAEYNCVDVLVCDEAHRLRPNSHDRFRKISSDKRQIDELVHSSKVTVFFIDDLQIVRPGEVGSSELIRDGAKSAGAELKEFELSGQFRCNGSEAFIRWVDGVLGISQSSALKFDGEEFDFRILDSIKELATAMREKAANGDSARLVAGFCWPWSDPTPDGQLVDDVVLGDFKMPWNARPDAGRLARGIPKSNFWASDPNGINQIGCVYTAQGFEFDYVGVIFGTDLAYSPTDQAWVGKRQSSCDAIVKRAKPDDFLRLVKQVYRILLTRGMKGCYVYFKDKEAADHFRSNMRAL